jgi:LCP family protein required for cell wall assembly
VTIPGYGEQRLNTVMQLGGFQLLADTLQTNFGVYPTEYAMIDLEGFLKVIDVLGGVTIDTEYATADACDSSLDTDGWCEVGPGVITLDSDWALWYVRARYNSSDFDRMRRTQEVVKAAMKKVLSPTGVTKIPSLMRIYESEVESNVSTDNIFPLIRLAIGFDSSSNIRHYSIGPDQVTPWITPQGANVLIPDTAAIQALIQDALSFE